jgi:Holliday junction resolvase RusA-like endonuclease
MGNKQWFIPGNVPSSKNSRVYTGRFFVTSKATKTYKKASLADYTVFGKEFRKATESLPKPLTVSFKFIRKSKHRFDYVNPLQTVQDFMVDAGWLDDDNADELLPVFEPYEYDKENPGVVIKLISSD